MGIRKFFKKVGSGIKKAASWTKDKFHKTVNVVKKFAKPVMGVVDKVSGLLANVPGKIGLIAGGVNAANGVANKIMDQIPGGAVKDKLQSAQNNAMGKAHGVISKGFDIANKVNEAGQKIRNVSNIVGGLAK